jgi:hypothetical protein
MVVIMWQDILKRVDIRNEREYERASLEDRKKWHSSQGNAYGERWRTMRNTQVENEDSPMYKEMVELQNLANFHFRQVKRFERNAKTYYSKDLEGDNRRKVKTSKSPQGNPIPYTTLSQEVYDTLTDEEKRKYHGSLQSVFQRLKDNDKRNFHARMLRRIGNKSNRATYSSSEHGGATLNNRDTSKEEYEGMTDELKLRYHHKLQSRFTRLGDKDKRNFHARMGTRLKNKSKRPIFYSQEEEQKNA